MVCVAYCNQCGFSALLLCCAAAGVVQVNETFGNYCYDVIYSPYSTDPHLLLMTLSMTEVTSRVCCVVGKTGRAVADLAVRHQPPAPYVHTSSHHLTFSMHCFHDESFSGSLPTPSIVHCLRLIVCLLSASIHCVSKKSSAFLFSL